MPAKWRYALKVYHGSYIEVPVIDLSKCEAGKDFGRAFYVTKFREQAEYWAKRKGRKSNSSGYITEYEYYENAFEQFKLKVLRFDSYNEEWLDFVVANRRSPSAVSHEYDIVEGPVANDDISTRILDYLDGKVSKTDFLEELKFKHQESHQIAFCTVASLQQLAWLNKKADSYYGINDAIIQSLIKERNITEEKAVDLYFVSKTYKQLIDKTTGLSTKSWENVYDLLKNELDIKELGT